MFSAPAIRVDAALNTWLGNSPNRATSASMIRGLKAAQRGERLEHLRQYVPMSSILFQGCQMKDQFRREWIALMQEGAHGQATRFRLRAMRLSQILRTSDPELAAALVSGLTETSALTRLAPTSGPDDVPDLLSVEAEPVLAATPHWPRAVSAELRPEFGRRT